MKGDQTSVPLSVILSTNLSRAYFLQVKLGLFKLDLYLKKTVSLAKYYVQNILSKHVFGWDIQTSDNEYINFSFKNLILKDTKVSFEHIKFH